MKKNLLRYTFIIIGIISLLIIYLSIVGLKTDKFNGQIKNKIHQVNKNFEVELKKIKLTLDPLNFKVNIKTIGPKLSYKSKDLQIEYIKSQISLISFIKNKIVSSKLELSTKSVMLKDLVSLARGVTNKPELYFLEKSIKNGHLIANLELYFDENGKIKKNYKITTVVKNGQINLLKKYNFEKVNFSLNIHNNIFNFEDISFSTNEASFFSKKLEITQHKKNISIKGEIENKDIVLNNKLLELININSKNIKFLNTNFNSKNKFSFTIDKKFKIKDLIVDSDIQINNSDYQKPIFFADYFQNENDMVKLKNHQIKSNFKNNQLIIKGFGEIKFEEKFDEIKYKISLKDEDLEIETKLILSELKLNSKEHLKKFFPELKEVTILKDQKIEISYKKKDLTLKGIGKIKFVNEYEDISFNISKIKNRFNFDTQIVLEKTLYNIKFLNFEKNDKSKTQINIFGNYKVNDELNFKKISIIDRNNKFILDNFSLNNDNQIKKVGSIDLNFFDNQKRKNKIFLKRINKNTYQLKGPLFNADQLIENLLNSKKNKDSKIFKNDFILSLDLKKVYLDEINIINNLSGNLEIRNNKVYIADINGVFDKKDNFKFTINTNGAGEKITTLFSSRAKPIVSRYKFIKGYEEGYLDFYSSKKNEISKSKINIYNFKLQELPALTKLLTLASLQGIADTLSGEGIRFNEFEMNFENKDNLMTIDEIYAIGPAISILMSGYIEENKLVSLRGTLVPATTINKSIGSIPFLGKILVGDRTGEGVFGVSFKIKGPPKKLETTVNPIKTLTPRFITRTLEKIKKN